MQLFRWLLRCGLLIVVTTLVLIQAAHAGNIFFGLSIADNKLTLTNQGNSTAFYPAVMRLGADGRWESLSLSAEITSRAELLAGSQIIFVWPNTPSRQTLSPLERLNTIMVRFFDQAGNSFGQISFFNQPPFASDLSQTGYIDGLMTISPPRNEGGNTIRASWLLWPQEEGIAPLNAPVQFNHQQPPATRVEWRPGINTLELDLGAGLPSAILLHETGSGFMQQNLSGGDVQGKQQRSAWLNANELFYQLAELAAAAAAILMLWHLVSAWRERSVT